jgi:iron complex outermembrane receptor protein
MKFPVHLGCASIWALSVACMATATPAFAQGGDAAPQQEGRAQSGTGIDDIVVTARRREESVQTAPVSITAQSGALLTQKNIVNVADLATSTPGLGIRRSSNTPSASVITIRGQVQSDPNITSDPSVGVYIGDMYVARAYGVLGDLLDIERVEVLRGPQGSLFGRNTIGGAIRIIPKKPDVSDGFTGFINGGLGNFSARSISGAITVPVVEDKLAIRYAGSYRRRDGYATGFIVAEPNITPIDSVKMNDYERETHRLSLSWRPADNFRFDLSGYLYHSNDNGAMVANINGDVTRVNLATFQSTFNNSPQRANDFYSVLIPVTNRDNGRPSSSNTTKYIQGTAEYDLTDALTAKLTLSALKTKATTINLNTSGVVTDAVALFEFTPTTFQRQNQKTAEFQLLGKSFDEHLDWILGAYYFKEKGIELNAGYTKVLGNLGGSVDFDATATNSSKSTFAYGDISLTDRLSVTLGARYTWDTKALLGRNRFTFSRLCIYSPGPNITAPQPPVANGPCLLDRSDNFDYFTYDTGISYKIANDIFLYAKANNGVRSGGQQPRAVNFASSTVFDPDKAFNYEAGIKADLFDRHLRINASGYHVNYQNVQQQIILAPPVTPTTTTQIVNLGNAKINGFEVETTARPVDGLTLEANLAYVKVKYANPLTVQRFTPNWQYTLAATYDFRLGDEDKLRLRADYNHISSFYMAQVVTDPKLPGYGLLNLRASYLIGEKYNVSLYMTNVTDKEYYTSGIISGNLAPSGVGEPRMYGAEFTYNF